MTAVRSDTGSTASVMDGSDVGGNADVTAIATPAPPAQTPVAATNPVGGTATALGWPGQPPGLRTTTDPSDVPTPAPTSAANDPVWRAVGQRGSEITANGKLRRQNLRFVRSLV